MATSDELFLFLTSSAPSPFSSRQNTPAHFCTQLNTPVILDGNQDFEVGVIRLISSAYAENVTDGEFSYYSFVLKSLIPSRIPSGRYELPEGLIQAFMQSLAPGDGAYYELSYDQPSRRFKLHTSSGDGSTEPTITFSPNLQQVTGFRRNITGSANFFGTSSWDSSGGNNTMQIFSNIVESSFVKDTKQPILGIFPYFSGGTQEITVSEPQNPIYIPMFAKTIHNVAIEIKNQSDKLFPFPNSCETVIILHIRPLIARI